MRRFENARLLVHHFQLFHCIRPDAALSRQLMDECEGLLMYLSSLPLLTLNEAWEWDGDINFAEPSIVQLRSEYLAERDKWQASILEYSILRIDKH